MKTFELSFRLISQDEGATHIGRNLDIQVDQKGEVTGVWIDGDPIAGLVHPHDIAIKLIGHNYLARRIVRELARSAEPDEMKLAKNQAELEMLRKAEGE